MYGSEYAATATGEQGSERPVGGPLPPFDFNELGPKGRFRKWTGRLIERAMPVGLWLARTFRPVPHFAGFYWITRARDVEAALDDWQSFAVPYGAEMRSLSRGADGRTGDFVLGLDGPGQARQNAIIRDILLPGDVAGLEAMAEGFADSLIDGGAGRLDVVTDFAVRIPTEICRRYFGLEIADPDHFADWSIAVSATLFADPGDDPVKDRLGRAGAQRLCHVIDRAIERAKRGALPGDFAKMTLTERLVYLGRTRPDLALDHPEIRAILLGLVTGFIPTNGLAGAKMIEEVMRNRPLRERADAAAAKGDVDAMRSVVREAGRLNPALAPGQWRRTIRSVKIGGRTIPAGVKVMASTQSAMRDRRRAKDMDPSELMFGHGVHKCLGQQLALAIIARMFLALFRQPGLRRAPGRYGRMQRVGYFPRRLDLAYDIPGATQTMLLIAVPIGVDRDAANAALDELRNPATDEVRDSLNATGIVHFASATTIGIGEGEDGPDRLVLEFNVDGTRDAAIDRLAQEQWLIELIRKLCPRDTRPLGRILRTHSVTLGFRPWGSTGLNFLGTGDFSVTGIERQTALRRRSEDALRELLNAGGVGLGDRAMLALQTVRRRLRDDADFGRFLVQPGRKTLAIARWRRPSNFWAPLVYVLRGGLGITALILFFGSALLFGLVADFAMRGDQPFSIMAIVNHIMASAGAIELTALPTIVAHLILVFSLSLLMAILFWSAVAAIGWGLLRWTESREKPDDQPPSIERMREILARENAPGYRQNHITAVTPLKRGLVRRLAFAVSMWGIRQSLYWFRPGYVVTMGTIHYAKWFRLPGSRKLIFQSNYDGSWESYLEDFITRAHPGQTAAWSNGEGFPRSINLIGEGAKDGDRFKRWVRRQQIPTRFWYSRFPELTTDDIRTNALIHYGLSCAATDTDARTWLDLFGSAPRQPYELESSEIQSILLRGLAKASFTACVPVRFPPEAAARGKWLAEIMAQTSFGKFPEGHRALFFGLSPTGLATLSQDAPSNSPVDLRHAFPAPFALGMAARGPVLGDDDPDEPQEYWRWRDVAHDGAEPAAPIADAVLMLYAPTREELDTDLSGQITRLRTLGGEVVHEPILTAPVAKDGSVAGDADAHVAYEHFGFRDGITTPIMRGNEKLSGREENVVEPGEFILGYRNNQGYFAPSIMVPPGSDLVDTLPVAAERTPFGYADFQGADGQFAMRDLGRNGSFMVIRQLIQDRDGFRAFTDNQAATLNAHYGADRLRETVGAPVTGGWFAAKLMGRWQNGQPLIGNPREDGGAIAPQPDDDFLFGRDDPRGHACPLGAHIRRANARDSLNPDDPLEQMVSRRHLLLRRGRTYFRQPGGGPYVNDAPAPDAERGLLFVALCADLERQFEFVQQSWLGFPGFHGLSRELDPIATRSRAKGERNFTIPTPGGPLIVRDMQSFVQMCGGGYFFVPSRSALCYLAQFGAPNSVSADPCP